MNKKDEQIKEIWNYQSNHSLVTPVYKVEDRMKIIKVYYYSVDGSCKRGFVKVDTVNDVTIIH